MVNKPYSSFFSQITVGILNLISFSSLDDVSPAHLGSDNVCGVGMSSTITTILSMLDILIISNISILNNNTKLNLVTELKSL